MFLKQYPKVLLMVIVIVAFIVRFIAIYPGHPPNHPDEPFVYDRANDMAIRHSIDPMKYYYYQILPMYFHEAVYSGVLIPVTLLQNFILHPKVILDNVFHFDTYVSSNIVKPNALYWGRLVVALLGVLSIILIYLLGKEIYDVPTALIAAFLLTFNYRHFLSSVLSLNDIPNAVGTLLMMLLLVRQLNRPTRKRLVMISILTGVVFSTKFQPFIFVPVGIALLTGALQRKAGGVPNRLWIFVKEFLFVFSVGALVVVVVNILPILHWREFNTWVSDVGVRNTVGKVSFRLYPYWFLYTIGIGPIVSWLALFGLALTLANKATRKHAFVMLSYFVWVFFFLSYYSSGGMFVRYFVPVIPLILLFASYVIRTFSFYLARRIPVGVITIALVLSIGFNYQSIINTVVTSYYYHQQPTLSCASNWVMSYLPEKSKVGIYPPAPMDALNSKKTDWVYFNQKTDFTLAELQEKNIQYVIINLSYYSNYFIRWVMQGARYWDMPTTIFDNMLPGLVIRELKKTIVYQCVKPWPVPDDNLIVIKVPAKIMDVISERILTHKKIELPEFSDWNIFPTNSSQLGYIVSTGENCHSNTCLQVSSTKAGLYDFVSSYASYGTPLFFPPRLESPQISARPGNIYQFRAWVKPQKLIPKDLRDGFFRMDFYTSNGGYRERKSGSVFVSQRVMGDGWQQISLEGIAPSNGKFLTVSFQTEYFDDTYLIDTIDLYQNDGPANDVPLMKDVQIDKRILYPSFIP